MKKTIFAVLFGIVLAAFNILPGERVDAASTTINLSPMSQSIILRPGETYSTSINISNPQASEEDLNYIVSVASFSQVSENNSKDDYGKVDTETVSNYNQIMKWISFGKTRGTVSPNQTDTIPITITVPSDAPAGGQYATIVVRDASSEDSKNNNVTIQTKLQIGSIIYAEVAGETRRTGAITENNFPSFLTTSKFEATSMVRNNGNVHTDAEYTLQVWPMFSDEELCTNEESAETSLIMPETERYHIQTCDLPTFGIFRAKQVVKIFGEESTLEKTIIVCPIWLMVLILIVIIAIIVAIVILIKRNKNRKTAAKAENAAEN